MAYDEGLAERLREVFIDRMDIDEKRMFGGLAFMCRDHMCVGIIGDELMVRVGVENYGEALQQAHAREMDFTGKALKGFVYVGLQGFDSDEQLILWVERALSFVCSLPPK